MIMGKYDYTIIRLNKIVQYYDYITVQSDTNGDYMSWLLQRSKREMIVTTKCFFRIWLE